MKKTLEVGSILSAIVIGIALAKFMFLQYDSKEDITLPVGSGFDEVEMSFLQVGVYSSKENMEKNLSTLENYIYVLEDEKFYVYVAITNNSSNSIKLKGYFEEEGYIIYEKKLKVTNSEFIEEIAKYDDLLDKTTDNKAIRVIISNVLTKYKETVIDDSNKGNTGI